MKQNTILLYLNIIILFLCISLSELNEIQEIILTISGPGEVEILNSDYSYYPDEIYIDGIKFNGMSSYEFNIENENAIFKLAYYNTPSSFANMFEGLDKLVKVDFSNCDTSNVNDMSNMFQSCSNLIEIDFSNFKTSSVLNMEGMFMNCEKITSLDLSNFDTQLVTNMKNMFISCENLVYLDVSNFDTYSVTDMESMFSNCQSLQSIDLTSFRTNNVNMNLMFHFCLELQSISFTNTNKLGVNSMAGMFEYCTELTSIDLSHFDTSSCTDFDSLFFNCPELISANFSGLDTSQVQKFISMFDGCEKLESLDLSSFVTTSATDMSHMFDGLVSLIFLDIRNFVFDNANTDKMFYNIKSITKFCFDSTTTNSALDGITNSCSDACFLPNRKLINDGNECVTNCKEYNNYYEYNNKCYSICPEGTVETSDNTNKCDKILSCKNYTNEYKTECFDTIPEGYYIKNIIEKIIDKCHNYCKSCEIKETEDNTNCLTCKDEYFFFNGNCSENCVNGFYNDDSGQKICNCPYIKHVKIVHLKVYHKIHV